MFKLKII